MLRGSQAGLTFIWNCYINKQNILTCASEIPRLLLPNSGMDGTRNSHFIISYSRL
jgi:hypothetical protein